METRSSARLANKRGIGNDPPSKPAKPAKLVKRTSTAAGVEGLSSAAKRVKEQDKGDAGSLSILTQLLKGKLGQANKLDAATKQAVWIEAFESDWQGDLALLPPSLDLSASTGLCKAHTRSMYDRLVARFPARANTPLSGLNKYRTNTCPRDKMQLLNIPMRHGWFDVLSFKYPIALGWFAIRFGHAGLLEHLVKEHGVDLGQYKAARSDVGAVADAQVMQMLRDAGNVSFCKPAL